MDNFCEKDDKLIPSELYIAAIMENEIKWMSWDSQIFFDQIFLSCFNLRWTLQKFKIQ